MARCHAFHGAETFVIQGPTFGGVLRVQATSCFFNEPRHRIPWLTATCLTVPASSDAANKEMQGLRPRCQYIDLSPHVGRRAWPLTKANVFSSSKKSAVLQCKGAC